MVHKKLKLVGAVSVFLQHSYLMPVHQRSGLQQLESVSVLWLQGYLATRVIMTVHTIITTAGTIMAGIIVTGTIFSMDKDCEADTTITIDTDTIMDTVIVHVQASMGIIKIEINT